MLLRKLLSILLLAVFALPLLAPLFARADAGESRLPACCRRNGKHHCMMSAAERQQLTGIDTRFRTPLEKCPYAPANPTAFHRDKTTLPTSKAVFAELVSHPVTAPQTHSRRRIVRDRSRQKRGPPLA